MEASRSTGGSEAIPIEDLLRLATAPPDLDLLRRYSSSLTQSDHDDARVTEAERKWVETNLAVNPIWRDAWAQVREQHRESSLAHRSRRLVIIAGLVVFLAAGWMEILGEIDRSVGVQAEEVIRGNELVAPAIVEQPTNIGATINSDGAWSLRPTLSVNPADTLIPRLLERFSKSSHPLTRSEVALSLGTFNELAGRYDTALYWYNVSDSSGSADLQGAAAAGAARMRRRSSRD